MQLHRTPNRLLCVFTLWVLSGCADPIADPRAPIIEAIRPSAAMAGSPVTVIGRNFGVQGDRDRIFLGGVELSVESWSDRSVLVRVPSAQPPGIFDLVIRSEARVSAPALFEVLSEQVDIDVGNVAP